MRNSAWDVVCGVGLGRWGVWFFLGWIWGFYHRLERTLGWETSMLSLAVKYSILIICYIYHHDGVGRFTRNMSECINVSSMRTIVEGSLIKRFSGFWMSVHCCSSLGFGWHAAMKRLRDACF